MTTISKDNKILTLINVFTVEPENQQKLIELLIEATEKTMKHISGFISANIHKSADGVRVVNYVQWQSPQHFAATLKNPEARVHMKSIMEIATFDAHTYQVAESISI
jgi:heme-degrading monooxygenase HmoA